jgi:hypothetical protein
VAKSRASVPKVPRSIREVGTTIDLFGNALEMILGDRKRYEWKLIILGIIPGLLIWLFHLYPSRRMDVRKEKRENMNTTNSNPG